MKYRKLGFFAAMVVATSLALNGCGTAGRTSSEAPIELSKDPVTLTVDWWGNADRAAQTQHTIAAFEAKYANVKIKPMYTDFATYFTQLDTQIAAGTAPDVLTMQDGYLRNYAENGVLLDLGRVKEFLGTSDFTESTLSAGQINGKLYALSIANSNMAIVVNKTMLDKYRIALPDDKTWTWKQLADLGAQISQACAKQCVGIDPDTFQANMLLSWVRQYPGEDFFDDQGKLILKEQTLADYWQYMLDLQESGATPSASSYVETWNSGQSAYPINTGKAALGFYADTWITQAAAGSPGSEIKLVRYPARAGAPEKWSYTRASQFWTISAKSAHPAEAALFVNFIANDPEAQKLFGTTRGLPANPKVLAAIQPALSVLDKAQVTYGQDIAAVTGRAYTPPPASSAEMTQLLQTYGEHVLFKQMTPQQAASEFLKALNASMARAQAKK